MSVFRPTVLASLRRQCAPHTTPTGWRTLSNSVQRPASVSDVGLGSSKAPNAPNGADGDAEKRPLQRPAHLSREAFEAKRARKVQQYQDLLQEKAKREGYSSVEDMLVKQAARKTDKLTSEKPGSDGSALAKGKSGLTEEDAKLAEALLKRVEAEAERKIKSGNFSSGPGMKTLGDIIDIERVRTDSPEKIAQLWTQYHTLKNKLSAVIPARQYADMIAKARQYPQFLLPLPRTIVGSLDSNDTANVAPGERKDGYEMQYMEWGFLPKPNGVEASENTVYHSKEDTEAIAKAPPTTVLFTPLAEYKLRQEYAQPVLILTHYTDLALSKGIVLLRGEVTEVQSSSPAPTGIAAAVAASQAGETSAEKLDKLKAPLQSQGKLSQQDAQLLTVTLQRFYLPKKAGADPQPGEAERHELLEAFHGDQDRFDLDKLCKSAFKV